jgi:anti-sigma regulatory factor (Ser/Thr protein kinase)
MRVSCAASSVGEVRRRLKNWMADEGLPGDRIDDARLVVSELVGNAVRHARPLPGDQISIDWRLEPRGLRISVTDGGAATHPHRVDAAPTATTGRGVAIVDDLAVEWSTESSPSRSTVHALVEVA